MAGIKETNEILIAANEIGVLAVKRLKDGFGFDDFQAFYNAFVNDAEFKAKLEAGFNGMGEVPAEIKDIDFVEGGQLVMTQVSYVPKYLEALK